MNNMLRTTALLALMAIASETTGMASVGSRRLRLHAKDKTLGRRQASDCFH